MKKTALKPLGLYVHIPFCQSKCAYCDFYSLPCAAEEAETEELQKHYISALRLQLEDCRSLAADYQIDSVYIGGGTPTVLDIKLLRSLIDTVYSSYDVSRDVEFTVEANPASADKKKLKKLRSLGVNRLSLGLQSVHQKELTALGRIHTYEDFEETYKLARGLGYDNISVDVMYGIPNQTKESFLKTLDTLTVLEPDHISMYGLKLEDGTPMAERRADYVFPDEDAEYNMYMLGTEFLEKHGYRHYEISNFAREGMESRHNLKYWNCDPYLAFGPGAASDFGGARFTYKKDINTYIDGLEIVNSDIDITSEYSVVSTAERAAEYVMLRMRLADGVDIGVFNERFRLDFESLYGKKLDTYIAGGFVKREGNVYSFTKEGMYVSNFILSNILEFESLKHI